MHVHVPCILCIIMYMQKRSGEFYFEELECYAFYKVSYCTIVVSPFASYYALDCAVSTEFPECTCSSKCGSDSSMVSVCEGSGTLLQLQHTHLYTQTGVHIMYMYMYSMSRKNNNTSTLPYPTLLYPIYIHKVNGNVGLTFFDSYCTCTYVHVYTMYMYVLCISI